MAMKTRIALRGSAMGFVLKKILVVSTDQLGTVPDHHQVLGVLVLGRPSQVETAGDQDSPIDDEDLVVSDGMLGVDERLQAVVQENAEIRMGHLFVATVKQAIDVEAA